MTSRRVEDLHPDFQSMVVQLLTQGNAAIAGTGWLFFITDGYRSMDEQERLYAQGRTTPGKVVTMARPGQSPHNYGLAVDCAFQKSGKLSYDASLYAKIYPIARKLGFELGADWTGFTDRPHFEFKNWKNKINEAKSEQPIMKTEYTLIPSRRSITVTADQGLRIRTGPSTQYQSLGTATKNQEFPVIGFAVGESVAGNNFWWVTLDEKFMWSGATNVIPTLPKEEPAKPVTEVEPIPIIESPNTELLAQLKKLTKEKNELAVANANLEARNSLLEDEYQNIVLIRKSNEVLQADSDALKNKNMQLKNSLKTAYATAFADWEFVQVESGYDRFKSLLAVLWQVISLYSFGMTQRHVIGFKKNASVYSAKSAEEVAAAFENKQQEQVQ